MITIHGITAVASAGFVAWGTLALVGVTSGLGTFASVWMVAFFGLFTTFNAVMVARNVVNLRAYVAARHRLWLSTENVNSNA